MQIRKGLNRCFSPVTMATPARRNCPFRVAGNQTDGTVVRWGFNQYWDVGSPKRLTPPKILSVWTDKQSKHLDTVVCERNDDGWCVWSGNVYGSVKLFRKQTRLIRFLFSIVHQLKNDWDQINLHFNVRNVIVQRSGLSAHFFASWRRKNSRNFIAFCE